MAAKTKRHASPGEPSLLAELFRLYETTGPLKICFEDMSGVVRDVPFLRLSALAQQHTCRFCLFAKRSVRRYQDCGRNKYAVNRLVLRRMTGLHGQCHLGLTDIVEPLVFHHRVLGAFYYGSVVLEGTEARAKQRIERYCARRGYAVEPYLEEFQRVPRISPADFPEYVGRLKYAAKLASALLESWGLPEERYRAEIIGPLWQGPAKFRNLPALVHAAIRYVQQHYSEPLPIMEIAKALDCHPVYLSRTFKKAMDCELGSYIQRVRVDHARQRLKDSHLSVAEVGYEVGFQEKSHFGRIFKKLVHLTPAEYRRQQAGSSGLQNAS